jgi:Leucine-rich repeat (LRR) protein
MDVNWLGNKELPDGSVNWAIFHQNKDLPPLDPLITTLVWTKGPLENLSGIGQLGNLRVLHLNGNRLSQLPQSLHSFNC